MPANLAYRQQELRPAVQRQPVTLPVTQPTLQQHGYRDMIATFEALHKLAQSSDASLPKTVAPNGDVYRFPVTLRKGRHFAGDSGIGLRKVRDGVFHTSFGAGLRGGAGLPTQRPLLCGGQVVMLDVPPVACTRDAAGRGTALTDPAQQARMARLQQALSLPATTIGDLGPSSGAASQYAAYASGNDSVSLHYNAERQLLSVAMTDNVDPVVVYFDQPFQPLPATLSLGMEGNPAPQVFQLPYHALHSFATPDPQRQPVAQGPLPLAQRNLLAAAFSAPQTSFARLSGQADGINRYRYQVRVGQGPHARTLTVRLATTATNLNGRAGQAVTHCRLEQPVPNGSDLVLLDAVFIALRAPTLSQGERDWMGAIAGLPGNVLRAFVRHLEQATPVLTPSRSRAGRHSVMLRVEQPAGLSGLKSYWETRLDFRFNAMGDLSPDRFAFRQVAGVVQWTTASFPHAGRIAQQLRQGQGSSLGTISAGSNAGTDGASGSGSSGRSLKRNIGALDLGSEPNRRPPYPAGPAAGLQAITGATTSNPPAGSQPMQGQPGTATASTASVAASAATVATATATTNPAIFDAAMNTEATNDRAIVGRTGLRRSRQRTNDEWIAFVFTAQTHASTGGTVTLGKNGRPDAKLLCTHLAQVGIPLDALRLDAAMQPAAAGRGHHTDWMPHLLVRLTATEPTPLTPAAIAAWSAQDMVDELRRTVLRQHLRDAVISLQGTAPMPPFLAGLNRNYHAAGIGNPPPSIAQSVDIATLTTAQLDAAIGALGENARLRIDLNEFVLIPRAMTASTVAKAVDDSQYKSKHQAMTRIRLFLGHVFEHSASPGGATWAFGTTYTAGNKNVTDYAPAYPLNRLMLHFFDIDENGGGDPRDHVGRRNRSDARLLIRVAENNAAVSSTNPMLSLLQPRAATVDVLTGMVGASGIRTLGRETGFAPWMTKHANTLLAGQIPAITVNATANLRLPPLPRQSLQPVQPAHRLEVARYRLEQGLSPLGFLARKNRVEAYSAFHRWLEDNHFPQALAKHEKNPGVFAISDADLDRTVEVLGGPATAAMYTGDPRGQRDWLAAQSGLALSFRTFMSLPLTTQNAIVTRASTDPGHKLGVGQAMRPAVLGATNLPLYGGLIPKTWRPRLAAHAQLLDIVDRMDFEQNRITRLRMWIARVEQDWRPGQRSTVIDVFGNPSPNAWDGATALSRPAKSELRPIHARLHAPSSTVQIPAPALALQFNQVMLDAYLLTLPDDATRALQQPHLLAWMTAAEAQAVDASDNKVVEDLVLDHQPFIAAVSARVPAGTLDPLVISAFYLWQRSDLLAMVQANAAPAPPAPPVAGPSTSSAP